MLHLFRCLHCSCFEKYPIKSSFISSVTWKAFKLLEKFPRTLEFGNTINILPRVRHIWNGIKHDNATKLRRKVRACFSAKSKLHRSWFSGLTLLSSPSASGKMAFAAVSLTSGRGEEEGPESLPAQEQGEAATFCALIANSRLPTDAPSQSLCWLMFPVFGVTKK